MLGHQPEPLDRVWHPLTPPLTPHTRILDPGHPWACRGLISRANIPYMNTKGYNIPQGPPSLCHTPSTSFHNHRPEGSRPSMGTESCGRLRLSVQRWQRWAQHLPEASPRQSTASVLYGVDAVKVRQMRGHDWKDRATLDIPQKGRDLALASDPPGHLPPRCGPGG